MIVNQTDSSYSRLQGAIIEKYNLCKNKEL